MKRFLGLIVGALLAIGVAQAPAKAATINLAANPADTDFTGNFHTASISLFPFSINTKFADTVTLNIASSTGLVDLDISTLISAGIGGLKYRLFSDAGLTSLLQKGTSISYAGLAAGTYYLKIVGQTFAGGYITKLSATAVTPIPPALLMFGTALVGLGFAGYRRRKAMAA